MSARPHRSFLGWWQPFRTTGRCPHLVPLVGQLGDTGVDFRL
ncbi:hypothetical protein [Streptomyces sp. NPDC101455]